MRRLLLLGFLAACGTADARGVIDDVHAWRFDAPHQCISPERGGGAIVASVGEASFDGLMGAVSRDSKLAPHREIEVSVLMAANTTVFVFSGYLPKDSMVFDKRIPRPPTEKLVEGQTVIAHAVNAGGKTLLYLHDAIDFKTGAQPQIARDGSSPCVVDPS